MKTLSVVYGVGVRDLHVKGPNADPRTWKIYLIWRSILDRLSPGRAAHYPAYEGCVIDDRFLRLSDFMAWAVCQEGYGKEGFQLDKDILIKGNKRYGPDTCVFVPRSINSLILNRKRDRGTFPIGVSLSKSGRFRAECRIRTKKMNLGWFDDPVEAFHAYKAAKESEIKRVAESMKSEIDKRAYAALMAYQVEITD